MDAFHGGRSVIGLVPSEQAGPSMGDLTSYACSLASTPIRPRVASEDCDVGEALTRS